jgi:ribokinase
VKLDVLVAGEVYVDLILGGFDCWPQPGHEAYATEYHREIGGGTPITACGLAALGTRTGLFGIAGSDHHAWIAGRLADRGVDTSLLSADPVEPTGISVAVTGPRDRAFFTYAGVNRHFEAAARMMPLAGVRHVHLAWAPRWEIVPELCDRIHRAGCTVSLDAGWHESWLSNPRALDLLRTVDILFPNENEASRLTCEAEPGRMLKRFAQAGLPCVALKLGAQGSSLLIEGMMCDAAPHPATPIDTTGAGDCFDAGFLHAWLRGESPQRCLAIGNFCGAVSTEAYGGIAGFPSRERLREYLKA